MWCLNITLEEFQTKVGVSTVSYCILIEGKKSSTNTCVRPYSYVNCCTSAEPVQMQSTLLAAAATTLFCQKYTNELDHKTYI